MKVVKVSFFFKQYPKVYVSFAINIIHMAYEYTLPVLAAPTFTTTYSGRDVAGGTTNVVYTGSFTLSAAQTLTEGFSATGGLARLTLNFTTYGTSASTLSATNTGIVLTILNNTGNAIVYGYVAGSTLNPNTSAATLTIKFTAPNYLATTFYLSGNKTTTAVLTSNNTTSVIDNPLVSIKSSNVTASTMVYNGLSAVNTNVYRTVSRQTRLVQYYEA